MGHFTQGSVPLADIYKTLARLSNSAYFIIKNIFT